MDVIMKLAVRSIIKLINIICTFSHIVCMHIVNTGQAIIKSFKKHKPWVISPHLAKRIVAVLFVVFLLALAPFNSKLVPLSHRSITNTGTAEISEVANSEGQYVQTSQYIYTPVVPHLIEETSLPESDIDSSNSALLASDAGINEEPVNPDIYPAIVDDETASFGTLDSDMYDVPEVSAAPMADDEVSADNLPIQEESSAESPDAVATVTPPSEDPTLEGLLEKDNAVIIPNVISHFSQKAAAKTNVRSVGKNIITVNDSDTGEQLSTVSTGFYHWPAKGTLTSDFGYRITNIGSTNHKGIDVAANSNDPVYASDGGEVIFSDRNGGYGNIIEILHDNGDVTAYAHCNSLLVSVGERVAQGQQIACMGSTGTSSGVHVHFELRIKGEPVNPELYLQ